MLHLVPENADNYKRCFLNFREFTDRRKFYRGGRLVIVFEIVVA